MVEFCTSSCQGSTVVEAVGSSALPWRFFYTKEQIRNRHIYIYREREICVYIYIYDILDLKTPQSTGRHTRNAYLPHTWKKYSLAFWSCREHFALIFVLGLGRNFNIRTSPTAVTTSCASFFDLCIFRKLILGSMTFWTLRPDDYIYFIIWPPTITFASFFYFCIFRKLILRSMTFWTLRPDDYIYFIIWSPTITFASLLICVFPRSSF